MTKFTPDYLKSLFYRPDAVPDSTYRLTLIRVPTPVYDAYICMYKMSCYMAHALKAVLEDNQHQSLMDEAEQAGHRLPDMKAFKTDLDGYMAFLKGIKPYDVKIATADELRVSYDTARAMQMLVLHNCLMLSWVLSGTFETDYLKPFTTLKERNTPYIGPVALQQAFNLYAGLAEVGIRHERYKIPPKQGRPPDPARG